MNDKPAPAQALTITQAMILAAGKGERMRPLTLTTPKPLLMVAGKPLVVWHIERLIAMGVCDIVVNVRHLPDVMAAFFKQYQFAATVRLSFENNFAQPLETAGGIYFALRQGLLKDEPFLLINGDVWTNADLTPLARHQLGGKQGHLLLVDNPPHNAAGDFVLLDGKVCPKSALPCATLTFAGISVLSPRLLDGMTAGNPAALAPFLYQSADRGCVSGERLTTQTLWVDVGTPERLADLEHRLAGH